MLAASDIDISQVMADLAEHGIEAGYIVPTHTAIAKSIMDAHRSLRAFFSHHDLHDFEIQGKGPSNKVQLEAHILTHGGWKQSVVSLYRPETKSGDPRIWFAGLAKYADPNNLLVLLVRDREIFLINASHDDIWKTISVAGSPFHELILEMAKTKSQAEQLLIERLRAISSLGFVASTTNADSGVGDTLESLLEIERNSSKGPDFMGIEIKASRITSGSDKQSSKNTLFSQSPDWGISRLKNSRELVDSHGYLADGSALKSLQVTVTNLPNSQGLFLALNESGLTVDNLYREIDQVNQVVTWELKKLEERLASKHGATFWVKARSRREAGGEMFQFVRAEITSAPLVGNFAPLISAGKITMDYTISEKLNKSGGTRMRDHGYLWRVRPADLKLLFPNPRTLDLTNQ